MGFVKRAWASISRRKGKSLILFAVIFILGNVIAGAISIKQSTGNVENTIKNKLGASATIIQNDKAVNKLFESNPEAEFPDMGATNIKTLKKIAELPSVKYFDYNQNDSSEVDKLNIYKSESEEEISGAEGKRVFFKGGNQPELIDERKGKIKIAEGRPFTKEEIEQGKQVTIISKQLAKLNNLKIGDKVVVDRSETLNWEELYGDDGQIKKDVEAKKITMDVSFEVVGIFDVLEKKQDKNEQNSGMMSMTDDSLQNTFYMSNKLVETNQKEFLTEIAEKNPAYFKEMYGEQTVDEFVKENSGWFEPYYELKNPEEAESFREDATALLTKYDRVLLATDQYQSVAGPLNQMSKLSSIVLYVAIGASLFIVTLVVLLFLRDRKHELGVYLALGEKKIKVVGQIVIEVMVVALIALTISVGTGNIIAKNVSNSLISAQQTKEDNYDMNAEMDSYYYSELSSNTVNQEDVVEAYEVKLSPTFIGTFYGVGLMTILLSTVIPLIYIIRLNPKKIMM